MITQETQTISCLLRGKTGLFGTFPDKRPQKIAFRLEDGTPLRLIGFKACHPSVVLTLGQKQVACFAQAESEKNVFLKNWRKFTESANAVLFTREDDGRHYKVEILKRAASPAARRDNKTLSVHLKKTGVTDEFIPCGG